ncbi:MAG: OB-fold nucleic acid binding domain-containing protein [Candidatus Caldarchaeum sp.]|uniref:Single-stranded DNA binding protein Ssb-like OB fold domain-containing protein n=1 Tax=Caldiarchaeum subterraneum TaxID=311458 RepID=A0A7C5Q810_CALS0
MSEFVKIGSLTPRSRGVNLVAKIVEKPEARVVSSQYDQSEHRLTEALIADETGAITLVLWDDNIDLVNEGDSVKVTNGFIKLFKGRMQLNLGRFGKIEPSDVEVPSVNVENNLSKKESFISEGRREKGGFRPRSFQRRRPFR